MSFAACVIVRTLSAIIHQIHAAPRGSRESLLAHPAMTSPTQRTLAALKAEGYTVAICEHWNPFARIRQDLFGVIDVLAIRPGIAGMLAVQCTTASNLSSRLNKIAAEPRAKTWLLAGGRLEVWGWRKRGPRGGRKVWEARRVILAVLDGRVAEVEVHA